MMDALGLLVKPAQEAAVSAAAARTAKESETTRKGGFSDTLNGLNGEQRGKGATREADAQTAAVENEAGTVEAATAETATATARPAGSEGALRSFAALKAQFQAIQDAQAGAETGETGENEKVGGKLRRTADGKTAAKTAAGAKAEADFVALGTTAEGETQVDAQLAARIVAKVATQAGRAAQEPQAATDETVAVTLPENGGETLTDMLGLLAAGGSVGQTDRKASSDADGGIETKDVSGKARAAAAEAGLGTAESGEAEAEAGAAVPGAQSDRLFRLTRGEGRGQSVDLRIASDTGGRIDVEARASAGGQAETVNVLEARRYLGFNAPSNSSALTVAMASNDEWVSAMNPASRLANEAQQSSTGQVVNTLKLELNPHSLGTVTAMLRLSGEELNVHLTVHTAAAYREMKEDGSAMLDALRSQGFSVDQVTVSMAPTASSQDGGDTGGRFSGQQQQNMQQAAGEGGRNGDQGARQGARGGSDGQPGIAAGRIDESEQVSSAIRGAGGSRPDHVYI